MGQRRRRVEAEQAYCDSYCEALAALRDEGHALTVIETAGGDPYVYDPSLPLEHRYDIAAQALTKLTSDRQRQRELLATIDRRSQASRQVGESVVWLCSKKDCPLKSLYQGDGIFSTSTLFMHTERSNGGSIGFGDGIGGDLIPNSFQDRFPELHQS